MFEAYKHNWMNTPERAVRVRFLICWSLLGCDAVQSGESMPTILPDRLVQLSDRGMSQGSVGNDSACLLDNLFTLKMEAPRSPESSANLHNFTFHNELIGTC
jgi:hypothetical protein